MEYTHNDGQTVQRVSLIQMPPATYNSHKLNIEYKFIPTTKDLDFKYIMYDGFGLKYFQEKKSKPRSGKSQ